MPDTAASVFDLGLCPNASASRIHCNIVATVAIFTIVSKPSPMRKNAKAIGKSSAARPSLLQLICFQ